MEDDSETQRQGINNDMSSAPVVTSKDNGKEKDVMERKNSDGERTEQDY